MISIKVKQAFAGALIGMIALFAPAGSADASTVKGSASICETGGRQSARYQRECMTLGSASDGTRMWKTMPVGTKGRERDGDFNQRSVCKFGKNHGGIRSEAREIFYDMAYDRFFRHALVLNQVSAEAVKSCRAMGYNI